MSKKPNIIGIIPARGGSKGVPKKNIKEISGFPMIAYSIVAGQLAEKIELTHRKWICLQKPSTP